MENLVNQDADVKDDGLAVVDSGVTRGNSVDANTTALRELIHEVRELRSDLAILREALPHVTSSPLAKMLGIKGK